MEMKAIAARMSVPEAAVKAIAAGCDVVLVCSGNHDLQVATLEAIIRAVEQDELPYRRVEEALAHQRAAKGAVSRRGRRRCPSYTAKRGALAAGGRLRRASARGCRSGPVA
jgi:beta-N-acetylhexosaminidase